VKGAGGGVVEPRGCFSGGIGGGSNPGGWLETSVGEEPMSTVTQRGYNGGGMDKRSRKSPEESVSSTTPAWSLWKTGWRRTRPETLR
jgi:hypothetical protein